MKFTVLGYWKDGLPILVGVVVGYHTTTGAITEFNDGPWHVHLEAEDDMAAGYDAVAYMRRKGPEPPLDEAELLIDAVVDQLIETGELSPDMTEPRRITDPVAIQMLQMLFNAGKPDEDKEDNDDSA